MSGAANPDAETSQKRARLSPETRRELILDAAQRLFFAHGWEAVTIADVLTEAGISKGGFYHHFTAKDDLFDGIVARFTQGALDAAQAVTAQTAGDALARFNAFIAATNRWKAGQGPQMRAFVDAMLRPGNDILFQRISSVSAAAAEPVLRSLIAEGVSDGSFDAPDVALVTEAILGLSAARMDDVARAIALADAGDVDAGAAVLDARMVAEAALIDRLLGLPPGSVVLSNPGEYRRMIAAMVAT